MAQGTRRIPLTRGLSTIVDEGDYEFLSQWKWHTAVSRNTFYAMRTVRSNGRKTNVQMHRVILGLSSWQPGGLETDHRDRDGLNNQRSNLRVVTRSVNCQNRTRFPICVERSCSWCERKFTPTTRATRYCSPTCRQAAELVRRRALWRSRTRPS